jgi:hypothetical protein
MQFIAEYSLAFSTVETDSFKNLVNFLNPAFAQVASSRTTVQEEEEDAVEEIVGGW